MPHLYSHEGSIGKVSNREQGLIFFKACGVFFLPELKDGYQDLTNKLSCKF